MGSLALDDAEQELGQLSRAFFSSEAAAECLGVGVGFARVVLAGMQRSGRSVRVCRDGWVLTLRRRADPQPPFLTAYLHDMMENLDVGYYISYPAAAQIHGSSHHGVLRQRVNVETDDMESLQLREADGPADLGVRFHQIDPDHGRAVTLLDRQDWCPVGDGRGEYETCTVRVDTIETALFDMVERPDRGGGGDHAATIARKALYKGLLDPVLLADASEPYETEVGRRVGSMLQQVRGFGHRINLRPLLRRVRSRPIGPPVEMFSGETDWDRRADRWGVTYRRKLDPDR